MTFHGKTPRYEFDGKNIKKVNGETEEKRNYFERLYDEHGTVSGPDSALENLRREREKHRIKLNMLRILLFVTVLTAAIGFALQLFFKADKIVVSGSGIYDELYVIKVCGLHDLNTVFTDTEEIESRIKDRLSLVKSVNVEKRFPDTIVITICDNTAQYRIKNGEHEYLMSAQLDVVGVYNIDAPRLPIVAFETVETVDHGKKISTGNTSQDGKIINMLQILNGHAIRKDVTAVEISKSGELSLKYRDRLTVRLGDSESFETKLTLAKAYADSLSSDAQGIIDAENVEYGSFLPSEYAVDS